MKKPSKLELIIIGICTIITMGIWLWLVQSHNFRDVALVLLAGLTGINGTVFFIGLSLRYGKNRRQNGTNNK